jgi:uncharacterized protein YdaU (DUF1376 family)
MPIYFGDFLSATARWTGEEQALYLLLLCYQWASGPLPVSANELALMVRYEKKSFVKLWKKVGTKFVETPDGLVNTRLEEHRAKSTKISEKRSTSGKGGAEAKWGADKTPGKTRAERLAHARSLGTHTQEEWIAIGDVCDHRCVRCGIHETELHGSALCKDHIVPIYQGGSDSIENIQPMCRNCNSSKGPDCTDHRRADWRELLAKRLANASQTPSETPAIQTKPSLRVLTRGEG